MEITLEKINERSDSYQLFLDSIKNKETSRRYRNLLQSFLKLIPDKIYQEILGEIPEDRGRETLARFFVALWVPAITLSIAGILLYRSSVIRMLIRK